MKKPSKVVIENIKKLYEYILCMNECHYRDLEREAGMTHRMVYEYLNFMETFCGIALERTKGRYGSVKLSKEWRKTSPHLLPEDEEMLLAIYEKCEDGKLKYRFALYILKCCNPKNIDDYRVRMAEVIYNENNHR
jgi:hypothetical protein